MRTFVFSLILLAGCQEVEMQATPESPEMQALIDACQSGNLNACQTVERLRNERRQAAAAVIGAMGGPPRMETGTYGWPMMR